jgi:tRNA uridine 5-carboxymethylaminomethyl modification enzyme
MKHMTNFDCIVVGGGHAGNEAALACSRMGLNTLLLTMKLDTIGQLSCNPSMGGLGKSQLIYEVDALGGEIGYATDRSGIGFRMLNTKKGPAVWSLRAQVDRRDYRDIMRNTVMNQQNLTVKEEEAAEIITESGVIKRAEIHRKPGLRAVGVKTQNGAEYSAKAVIVTTGTFLDGLIHIGLDHYPSGRMGEPPSQMLSSSLKSLGFELGRLKTGTSPRVDGRTIDFPRATLQPPDTTSSPFSHRTEQFDPPKVPCHITRTNKKTRDIILANLDRSPLYQGVIVGTGPRYCPSIEDKYVKFGDKEGHQVFIEPDGLDTHEYYLNGLATSLPEDVQANVLHSIPGLEAVEIIKPGYGIEYDFVFPHQIRPTLETKGVENLWLAGQILGTSGYEEAAAQGLIAGINAGLSIKENREFVLKRHEAYIGVLIDDLVTMEIREPYRMFTSRVEHRLILRQDNAGDRLMKYGVPLGLVKKEACREVEKTIKETELKLEELKALRIRPEKINPILMKHGSPPVKAPVLVWNILKRPEMDLKMLEEVVGQVNPDVRTRIELHAKYDGYIERERQSVEKVKSLENYRIPESFDYSRVNGLSREAHEKLSNIRPLTVGQANRISGVRFADITCLLVALKA